MYKQTKKSSTRLLLGLLALAVVIGGGLAVYKLTHRTPASTAVNGQGASRHTNLSPATDQDKQENEAHKDQIVQNAQSTTPASGDSASKKTVTPVTTNATSSSINAYVPGVFEDGGSCTATFTKAGATTITKTSAGFANATNTGCAPIQLSSSDFPTTGTWTVVVSYSSNTATGSPAGSSFNVD